MAKIFKRDLNENRSLIDPVSRLFRIYPAEGALRDYGEDLGSPSAYDEIPVVRALLCSEAMTVTLVDTYGITRVDVPLVAGWNPCGAVEVHSISTGTIWGCI